MVQTAPVRKVPLGPTQATFVQRDDGAILIRSPHALPPYPSRLTARLVHWAECAPERTFMAQRDATGAWRTLSYKRTLTLVRGVGQALLNRGLSPERPVAILSENGLEHAVLAAAAMHV